MSSRRLSERSTLLPFVVATGDASPRDQRDLMERPFFSLAKARRTTPILYGAGDIHVEVHAVPEHGMATIWDADVLIWAASQIVEAENLGFTTSRFLRFTPYQLLTATGRQTGARDYRLLKGALTRLQSTSVLTTIRNGDHWRRHRFSWVNEWEECTTRAGRVEGMDMILPDWFYRGVVDRSLVLTIDPAYFRLSGGIERWLYRVARKHAGRQPRGWLFEIAHLHEKSGSLARLADFAFDLRRIAVRNPLPGYRLHIERDGRRELLRILPLDLSTGPVDGVVDGVGTSGVPRIGISGVRISGLRECETPPTLWPDAKNRALNLSNPESNSYCRGARSVENPSRRLHNHGSGRTEATSDDQPLLPFDRKTGDRP
jgi:plasmid replication initiation protein